MRAAGIVLCGGRSSRMGRPKAWLPFGNEFMLARVVRVLREAVDPVVVVAAPDQDVPPLPPAVRIIRDEIEGKGPLGGLAAGLAALPGVMTPSEGFAALKAGADGLKRFPAEIIPPAVFKAWRAVFPTQTLLLAVGGVTVENLKSYAAAGASGYGIGSALYKPGRSADDIGRLAAALVSAAKG